VTSETARKHAERGCNSVVTSAHSTFETNVRVRDFKRFSTNSANWLKRYVNFEWVGLIVIFK
jgi:hypothetical protein